MMQTQVQSRGAGNQQVSFDQNPDHCPICLHGISPVDTGQRWAILQNCLEIVFRCPRQECEHFFIARYNYNNIAGSNSYRFSKAVPLTVPTTSNFSEIIRGISANFSGIYCQAEEAELRDLKLICGPGYRKALEFLIKDYLIRLHPDKEDEIKKMLLGQCISKYVKEGNVKEVARRAVWLGNDEVHYLRKWDEKELKDLKTLIELTVHWIEMEKLTEEAIKDMPEGK